MRGKCSWGDGGKPSDAQGRDQLGCQQLASHGTGLALCCCYMYLWNCKLRVRICNFCKCIMQCAVRSTTYPCFQKFSHMSTECLAMASPSQESCWPQALRSFSLKSQLTQPWHQLSSQKAHLLAPPHRHSPGHPSWGRLPVSWSRTPWTQTFRLLAHRECFWASASFSSPWRGGFAAPQSTGWLQCHSMAPPQVFH